MFQAPKTWLKISGDNPVRRESAEADVACTVSSSGRNVMYR